MILVFASIGAIVGFIPFGSFILIPLEVFLLYKIMDKYNAFELMPFMGVAAMLVGISTVLKGLAALLNVIPMLGWFANAAVAFGFIYIFGTLAERHYSRYRRPPPPQK